MKTLGVSIQLKPPLTSLNLCAAVTSSFFLVPSPLVFLFSLRSTTIHQPPFSLRSSTIIRRIHQFCGFSPSSTHTHCTGKLASLGVWRKRESFFLGVGWHISTDITRQSHPISPQPPNFPIDFTFTHNHSALSLNFVAQHRYSLRFPLH